MPDQLDNPTLGFLTGITDHLPYAVSAKEAKEKTGKSEREKLTDEDLGKTRQAYLVDAPLDPTRLPAEEETTHFKAFGAKEGHGTGRGGVALIGLDPAPRGPSSSRRPVVALVDSLVRPHPWLGDDEGDDPFWRDARAIPDGWRPFGDLPPELAIGFALMDQDDPRFTHAGHGTFLAGLVRQIAPDARVLSMPVMYRSGIVNEVLVQSALDWLLERCGRAQAKPELFVDVVNLSFGEYLRGQRNVPQDGALLDTIRALGDLGVRVVASAGNRATQNPVIPAAWAPVDSDRDRTGLVSVGALAPNGKPAIYSNTGDWVRDEAPGTALVSTLPMYIEVDWPDDEFAGNGKGEDPNLQASGFGRWSGTSFAAGWLSATITKHLLDAGPRDRLGDVSPEAAKARARTALAAARVEVAEWKASRARS